MSQMVEEEAFTDLLADLRAEANQRMIDAASIDELDEAHRDYHAAERLERKAKLWAEQAKQKAKQ